MAARVVLLRRCAEAAHRTHHGVARVEAGAHVAHALDRVELRDDLHGADAGAVRVPGSGVRGVERDEELAVVGAAHDAAVVARNVVHELRDRLVLLRELGCSQTPAQSGRHVVQTHAQHTNALLRQTAVRFLQGAHHGVHHLGVLAGLPERARLHTGRVELQQVALRVTAVELLGAELAEAAGKVSGVVENRSHGVRYQHLPTLRNVDDVRGVVDDGTSVVVRVVLGVVRDAPVARLHPGTHLDLEGSVAVVVHASACARRRDGRRRHAGAGGAQRLHHSGAVRAGGAVALAVRCVRRQLHTGGEHAGPVVCLAPPLDIGDALDDAARLR
eukprot:PhM_4_TR13960/c1_g2_i5/m.91800